MRYSQSEKMEIIRLVEGSDAPVSRVLAELGVARRTFYSWYRRYRERSFAGLANEPPNVRRYWNKIPEEERQQVVEVALDNPELTPRELAWHITDTEGTFISKSSVYRILKAHDLVTSPNYIVLSAADEFEHKTKRVNELWQTDFTFLKVIGWGWFYLSTILDDYSRYIIAWLLTDGMGAVDVKHTLDLAIERTRIDNPEVVHKLRLLSDNGSCYIAGDLKEYLADAGINHIRGKPYHPMTQGKIERYHRTMKNVVKLENYYMPWELEQRIGEFVEHYNHQRVHESLENLTPADVYLGRDKEILAARQIVKEQSLRCRTRKNMGLAPLKQDLTLPQMVRESVS
jgi:transposase InsO family protein